MYKLLKRITFCLLTYGIFALSSQSSAHTVSVHAVAGKNDSLSVDLVPKDNGVQFVLSNNGDVDVSVLTWETPLEAELTQDVFHLTADINGKPNVFGNRAQYSGRLIKRSHPAAKDFVTVKAGESVSTTIALSDYYRIGDGAHRVSFAGEMVIQSTSNKRSFLSAAPALQVIGMQSEPVSVNLTSVPETQRATIGGFTSCSADQQVALASDINAAETIATEARIALTDLPESERPTSPRYLQWFGAFSPDRYETVTDIYRNAEQVFEDGSTEFVCDCDEPFFAFVFPIDPFKVYLCEFYWRAAQTGTDSRAGTIVHELSHFPEVGGTDDNAYGQLSAANLARDNPASSVNNADSIEYFAENTPFIEISSGGVLPPQQIEFTQLSLDTPVTGSLAEGESAFFKVDEADFVELTSLSGDADLFIFSSATLTEQLCQSIATGVTDLCELSGLSTAFIQVAGFTASDYSLQATANNTPAPVEELLAVGETRSRSIGFDEFQFYTIQGADFVELNSLSGDADLAIHSDESRLNDSLLCISNKEDPLDVCEFTGETAYVTVYGFTAADYQITGGVNLVVAPPPQPPVQEIPDPPITDEEPEVTVVSEPSNPPNTIEEPDVVVVTEPSDPPITDDDPEVVVVSDPSDPPTPNDDPEVVVVSDPSDPPTTSDDPEVVVVSDPSDPPITNDDPEVDPPTTSDEQDVIVATGPTDTAENSDVSTSTGGGGGGGRINVWFLLTLLTMLFMHRRQSATILRR